MERMSDSETIRSELIERKREKLQDRDRERGNY